MTLLPSLGAQAFTTGTIWIPNDQTEATNTWRVDNQLYFTLDNRPDDPNAIAPSIDLGVTYAIYRDEHFSSEIGIDWWEPVLRNNDRAPHANAKFVYQFSDETPSIAIGVYDLGFFQTGVTNYNVVYVGTGETFNETHFFVGAFIGNASSLVDQNGNAQNAGVLLSVVRPVEFISDRFSAVADFQSSFGPLGALNLGGTINVTKYFDFTFGYDIYNNQALYARNTVTTQTSVRF